MACIQFHAPKMRRDVCSQISLQRTCRRKCNTKLISICVGCHLVVYSVQNFSSVIIKNRSATRGDVFRFRYSIFNSSLFLFTPAHTRTFRSRCSLQKFVDLLTFKPNELQFALHMYEMICKYPNNGR